MLRKCVCEEGKFARAVTVMTVNGRSPRILRQEAPLPGLPYPAHKNVPPSVRAADGHLLPVHKPTNREWIDCSV